MIIKILGNKETEAYKNVEQFIKSEGYRIYDDSSSFCHIAIAPLLTTKVSDEELHAPIYGTLIFHPSPLPYGRGASSIRWAYRRHEPITAATWFWANSGLDTGDICEQEIVKIDYSLRPSEFYKKHILPAMLRTLERCLNGILSGLIRRIPQIDSYATFDKKL